MNTLKVIQTSSLPRNHSFFHARKPVSIRRSTATHCNSNGKASESPPPTEGDKQKQELLAQIAMLQAQKVRLTDFLDERSAYLTQFAEDANAEFDEIAENARKELDEAGARIMENLENKMQSFEEKAELNRQEIEENEKILEDFEDQIERDRNEGLFFKNLRKTKPPKQMEEAKEEARKLKELARESAGSKVRRNIYLGLISLLTVAIVQAIVSSPEVEWRKVIALALIALALLAQFIYEQSLSSTSEKQEEKEK
ncbi:hypothetical protein QJS10_CPA03g01840 [Acorus calamus]|uniref:Uncharacterized protein n=1 Tax=Acorus calamus TaxID=4465 RepID=A0AAV9F7M7_ACOCL|nr:hypothetical protein QJS10_CPA03g01840 [Acorus calamus]